MANNLDFVMGITSGNIESLPERREEFDKNQVPITAEDRQYINENLGRLIADEVLRMQRVQHTRGGVNPRTVNTLYPEGLTGELDLNELKRILANHIVWRDSVIY